MAYCDVCGNFDDSYNNESSFNQEWKDARKEFDENYQPDLYYYCLLYTSDAADD